MQLAAYEMYLSAAGKRLFKTLFNVKGAIMVNLHISSSRLLRSSTVFR